MHEGPGSPGVSPRSRSPRAAPGAARGGARRRRSAV